MRRKKIMQIIPLPDFPEETLACIRLWRAKIDQAFYDAFPNNKKDWDSPNARRARWWFEKADEEYIETCSAAFVDDKFIQEIYRRLKKQGGFH